MIFVGGTTLATTATTTAGVSVTTYTVAGAAINAGISTLASQAAVTLINNKGDVGKTLEELGKSENVRNIVAAMLTAGVGTAMPSTSMTGVVAQTATGCTTGEMVGIGCESGATNAAVTSGAALAYTTMVGYTADLRPGENRNGTKPDGTSTGNATYVPDKNPNSPTFGQQRPADVGMNVIGLNQPGSIMSQGGTISRTLNYVPFVNAAGGWHDYIFNANPGLNDWFTVLNVPAMIPAAMLAIPASLNDPSVSWLFVNGRPYSLDTPPPPPIISSPSPRVQPVLSVNTQGARP